MIDPKKDYELLMRYLQGGEGVRRAPVPEQPVEEWQPVPQPTTVAAEPLPQPAETPAAPAFPKLRLEKHRIGPRVSRTMVHKKARLAIAVLSAILLMALLWNGYYFYQLSPDAIFNKLYVPLTSANNSTKAGKTVIENYYAAGNFVAVTLQSKKQQTLTDREQLLTGLAFLHREDYIKAIKWLEPLSNNFKSLYRRQAEYYLALTYLKNEDYDRSIHMLEHIRLTPSHPYRDHISERTIDDIKMLKWK